MVKHENLSAIDDRLGITFTLILKKRRLRIEITRKNYNSEVRK